jgi:hypothetical protein
MEWRTVERLNVALVPSFEYANYLTRVLILGRLIATDTLLPMIVLYLMLKNSTVRILIGFYAMKEL